MNPLPEWLAAFGEAVGSEYRTIGLLGEGGMASVLLAEERAPALRAARVAPVVALRAE